MTSCKAYHSCLHRGHSFSHIAQRRKYAFARRSSYIFRTLEGLRLRVVGGGCSGFSYELGWEDAEQEGDQVVEASGVKVYVDPMSAPYLSGAQIDFVDSLYGSGFSINNPNAKGSCGCGHSFQA